MGKIKWLKDGVDNAKKEAKAAAKQAQQTEFELAQAEAQRVAALPVEQGGLGLPADNTRQDRAMALGYDVENPVYHGTKQDFNAFDMSMFGSQTSVPSIFPKGIYTSPHPDVAGKYGAGEEGSNVMPLLINKKRTISASDNMPSTEAFKVFNSGDADTFISNNVIVARNPNQLRSPNAAFNPAKKDSSDILASLGLGTAAGAGMQPAHSMRARAANNSRCMLVRWWLM